ncbi:hypothetical protein [Sinanaerobacter sp. ZZT-01]|uniref:hypothetical protein n=1 Tax=Sinanaerobacter sp. ZZT-01 TaxID=3111540 RepID=UPI002D791EE4|nr:hypothetical protein [Sinanaerobacter sp. ZZT-01]WRR93367.1 hypothetical protein U5921_15260 [Sinanaerobacter sp. ZZT-01]
MNWIKKKARTVEQFKILHFLNENFMPNSISIELLGRNEVKITDRSRETEKLFYDANSKSVMPEENQLQQLFRLLTFMT